MIILLIEIFVLTCLAFAIGVLAGRIAFAVSNRAAAAAPNAAALTPEMDPDTDIEQIYAMFEPEEPVIEPEPEEPPLPASSQIGQIPDPAPPAQVKFERLLREAREGRKRREDEASS